MEPECRYQADHADRKLAPDHRWCVEHDRSARQHHQDRRGEKPPRQADHQCAADRIGLAQFEQLALDHEHWRAVIEPCDLRLDDRAECDQADAIHVHRHAGEHYRHDVALRDPDRREQQQAECADHHLNRLSPHQRTQSAPQFVEATIAEYLQIQCFLLFQPTVKYQPGLFEIVEFHCIAPGHCCAALVIESGICLRGCVVSDG